jgi:hypothetical protein
LRRSAALVPYELTRCLNPKRSTVSTRALHGNFKYRSPTRSSIGMAPAAPSLLLLGVVLAQVAECLVGGGEHAPDVRLGHGR